MSKRFIQGMFVGGLTVALGFGLFLHSANVVAAVFVVGLFFALASIVIECDA